MRFTNNEWYNMLSSIKFTRKNKTYTTATINTISVGMAQGTRVQGHSRIRLAGANPHKRGGRAPKSHCHSVANAYTPNTVTNQLTSAHVFLTSTWDKSNVPMTDSANVTPKQRSTEMKSAAAISMAVMRRTLKSLAR